MDAAQATTRLAQGAQAVMLQHTQRKLRDNQRSLNQHRKLPSTPAEDDMLILGDVTVTQSTPAAARKGGLLRALLLTGLAATGVGLPVAAAIAAPAVIDWLRRPAAVAPVTDPPPAPHDYVPILLPGRPETADAR